MSSKAYKASVIACVGSLAEAFGRTASDTMVRAYMIGLDGLEPGAVERATGLALRSCRFMPTPAELRELAGEIKTADRAEIAWAVLERTVRLEGGYRSVCFDDPALNFAVNAIGGWRSICEMPATEFDTFLRQKFLKTYEAAVRTRSGAGAMLGIFAAENARDGHARPAVVLVTTGLPEVPGLPLITSVETPRAITGVTPLLKSVRDMEG